MTKRKAPAFDRTQAKIEQIIADARLDAVEQLEHDFAWALEPCESPIEKLFAAAFIDPSLAREYDSRVEMLRPASGKIEHCSPTPIPGVFMWQQISIGPYRVDFMFEESGGAELGKLIVECDGHDFHEKTKDQAIRDKSRDRFLVGRGYRVLRFTGAEIYADPHAAAHQTMQILMGIAE